MRPLIAWATLSVLALGLAGCGRRGPLEAPPQLGAPQTAAPAPKQADSFGTADLLPSRPKQTPIGVPKQSFILDPLL
ncbi:MAG: lipoprotein [Hyphomicrobiales bacterium]|nr:lipoprotein [Hyphomicrobiales bacterium]